MYDVKLQQFAKVFEILSKDFGSRALNNIELDYFSESTDVLF
jgi:hypothetical protein